RLQVDVNNFSGCAPLTVQFENTGTPAVTYSWNLDNGIVSNISNPIAVYQQPGQYNIVLIATDLASCNIFDTAYATVQVFQNAVSNFDYQPEFPTVDTEINFTNLS